MYITLTTPSTETTNKPTIDHAHSHRRQRLRRLSSQRHDSLLPLAPLQRHADEALHGDGDRIAFVIVAL